MKQTIDAFIERFQGRVEPSAGLLWSDSSARQTGESTPSGKPATGAGPLNELTLLVQSLTQQTKAVGDNTAAVSQATQSVDTAGASFLSFAKQSLGNVSSGGGFLGLSPIVSLISGLFRRTKQPEQPPELPKIEMPDPLSWNLGVSSPSIPGVGTVSYSEAGLPKRTTVRNQVTVQIQAMDARSFLDRSGEIASALRSAMLHSSSINDVVAEME